MKRFKPNQNLKDLIEKFSKKNSHDMFKELMKCYRQEKNKHDAEERLKGGEYENITKELETLERVTDNYKPFYIEYTGNKSGLSIDGILYFKDKEQKIEITSLVDAEEIKSMRESKCFSQITVQPLVEMMQNFNYSENDARKCLKSQINSITQQSRENVKIPQGQSDIPEDFLYKKILSVLKKKNNKKYNNFWLLISYFPCFTMIYFEKKNVRKYVLEKIQSEEKELIFSIRSIFKKIIFVPFKEDHKIFEWSL